MQSRIEAFQAGADDYLLKPVVDEELRARVRVRLDRLRLQRERSDTDPVSGLLLRRRFMSMVAARLDEARRKGRIKFHRFDIRSDGVAEIFAQAEPEVVFNLAAQASVPVSVANPFKTPSSAYRADLCVKIELSR